MFKLFKPKNETTTQELIDAANSYLFGLNPDNPEYDDALEKIERLHKLHSREKEGFSVSPDTLLLVIGNLAGILLILNFEKLDVIGSKAIGFVIKPKS